MSSKKNHNLFKTKKARRLTLGASKVLKPLLSINKKTSLFVEAFVGVAGFEPATSCSQSRRDDRTTLHPVHLR